MGLFSDLDKFGLSSLEHAQVINKSTNQMGDMQKPMQIKTPEEKEKDAIYDKQFTCPVCDQRFTSKVVRAGKLKLSDKKDTDLRPIYEDVDPIKYDVITCDKCGYSALSRYFGRLSMRQIKDLYDQIGSRFTGIDVDKPLYSYDDAITRYKLALVNSIVKKAKNSERAYTSMKLAWIFRGKRLTLDKQTQMEEIKQLYQDELECISNAYDGFIAAMESETFPIAGMDDSTLTYIIAEFARRLGKYEECARMLSRVLTSKESSQRLKDQALVIKELLKKDIKNH
ncbi:MAG: DUF2225 domain-containing protein [Lachnospiraceae bacterium]|nr:DUF2225 domain-containing protein [Lachnospiraceae bacterium]